MTQDINTKSRRHSKANSGGKKAIGEKALKSGEKKSLDIDFASIQSDAVGSPAEESESPDKDAAYVAGASQSPAIKKKTQSVQYYNAQSDKQSVKADQQKEPVNKESSAIPDEKIEQKPAKIVIENPGEILRAAREARNVSQEDIAKWLKLDVRLIDALERGDDSAMPETVYKVGYLRSYAKLVELSPDTVIGKQAGYSKTPRFEPTIEPNNGFNDFLKQISQLFPSDWTNSLKDNDIKRGTFLAISIISFIAIAWITASMLRSNQDSKSTQDIPQKMNQKGAELGVEPLHSTSLEISPDTVLKKSGDLSSTTTPLPSDRKVSTLVLNFSADSWVDIRDATGAHLIRRLGLAGMSKKVSGVAPFQVLIGYAPGVTIAHNGKPYDFTAYQGKRVARFIIEPEAESN